MGKGRGEEPNLRLPALQLNYIDDISKLKGYGPATPGYFGFGDDGTMKADQTPITSCVQCGSPAEDPTRDTFGERLPEHHFSSEEEKQALCFRCLEEKEHTDLETQVLELLESKLGLSEKDRDALRSFIETIFTDPKKILKVQDVENRTSSLETQVTVMWGLIVALIGAILAIALTSA